MQGWLYKFGEEMQRRPRRSFRIRSFLTAGDSISSAQKAIAHRIKMDSGRSGFSKADPGLPHTAEQMLVTTDNSRYFSEAHPTERRSVNKRSLYALFDLVLISIWNSVERVDQSRISRHLRASLRR
jgi:hypothetical protein